MSKFDSYIKDLRREIEALKTERRRSSLTFTTKTITTSAPATMYKTQNGNVIEGRYNALVEIIPRDDTNRLIFGFSQPAFSTRQRDVRLFPWILDNGNPGVLMIPYRNNADESMANGSTKEITLSLTITASGDFTTQNHKLLGFTDV